MNTDYVINYIWEYFRFGVQTSWGWHRRAWTSSTGERPYFVYVYNLCMSPCTRNNVHKYRTCCHNNIITKRSYFNTWF